MEARKTSWFSMGLDEAGGIYLMRASVDESYVVRDPKYLGAGHYLSLTTTGFFFERPVLCYISPALLKSKLV